MTDQQAIVQRYHGVQSHIAMAAHDGHLVVVRYLVEQGVDMNKAANNGPTPLLAAILKGHDEVAAFLHAAGASV